MKWKCPSKIPPRSEHAGDQAAYNDVQRSIASSTHRDVFARLHASNRAGSRTGLNVSVGRLVRVK